MNVRLATLGALASALLGCPASAPPGDVQFGDYTVTAQRRDGGTCRVDPGAENQGSFTFLARLGADYDGGAYLTVQQPPGAVSQQPRRGEVADGGFLFQQRQVQDLSSTCGCTVDVEEDIALYPGTGVADAGVDGGLEDGGVAPDAGVTDAGPAPIPGLPPPDAVTGVTGGLDYRMSSSGTCPSPEQLPDGGVSGCVLPCTFGYDLSGERSN